METQNTNVRHSRENGNPAGTCVYHRTDIPQTGAPVKPRMTTYKGFTLVELIVVITILVILGTIAFINLGGYSSSARDGTRIENLANLQKGLSVYQAKAGTYPMPEGPLNILASGSIIGYQGFAKDQVAGLANLSAGGTKDPSDSSIYTTYSVNANQTNMQVMAFLENGSTITGFVPLLPTVSASSTSDYSARTPTVKWDDMGTLLGNTGANLNQPIQELYDVNAFTGVDVVIYTGSVTAVFNNNTSLVNSGVLVNGKSVLYGMEMNYKQVVRVVFVTCPAWWRYVGDVSAWTGLSALKVFLVQQNLQLCENTRVDIKNGDQIFLAQSGSLHGWAHTGDVSAWSSSNTLKFNNVVCSVPGCSIYQGNGTSITADDAIVMQSCPANWNKIGYISAWSSIGNAIKCGWLDHINCDVCQMK